MSAIAMIYIVFYSVNTNAFTGLNNYYNFLAISERLAYVLAMEENEKKRETDIGPKEASIEMANASYGWGFRVKEDQSGAKAGRKLVET